MTNLATDGNGYPARAETENPTDTPANSGWMGDDNEQTLNANTDDHNTHCVAAVVRIPALSSLLRIGSDGETEDQPNMVMALNIDSPEYAALWAAAQQWYQDYDRVPDRESFTAVVQDTITQIPDFGVSRQQIYSLVDEVFSDRYADLNAEFARNLLIELLERHLVYQPQTRALRDWEDAGGEVPRVICRRAQDIQAALDAHRSGQQERLRGYSVAELRRVARPPEWHVQGILVQGETTFGRIEVAFLTEL